MKRDMWEVCKKKKKKKVRKLERGVGETWGTVRKYGQIGTDDVGFGEVMI